MSTLEALLVTVVGGVLVWWITSRWAERRRGGIRPEATPSPYPSAAAVPGNSLEPGNNDEGSAPPPGEEELELLALLAGVYPDEWLEEVGISRRLNRGRHRKMTRQELRHHLEELEDQGLVEAAPEQWSDEPEYRLTAEGRRAARAAGVM